MGALRVCSFSSPAIVRALAKETAAANRADRPTLLHFKRLLFFRNARMLDQPSNAATLISITRPITLCMAILGRSGERGPGRHQPPGPRVADGAVQTLSLVRTDCTSETSARVLLPSSSAARGMVPRPSITAPPSPRPPVMHHYS